MIGCIRVVAPYGPAVGTEDAEGFVARLAGERGNHHHPHRPAPARERRTASSSPRHPPRGVPSEGGSDAATRWNPTGEGSASVPGLPHGSVARPIDGRASGGSRRARFAPDGAARGV